MVRFPMFRKKLCNQRFRRLSSEMACTFSRVCESLFMVFLKAIWISASKSSSSASRFSSEVAANGSQSPNVTICSECPELVSNSAAWALLAACKNSWIFNHVYIQLLHYSIKRIICCTTVRNWPYLSPPRILIFNHRLS